MIVAVTTDQVMAARHEQKAGKGLEVEENIVLAGCLDKKNLFLLKAYQDTCVSLTSYQLA